MSITHQRVALYAFGPSIELLRELFGVERVRLRLPSPDLFIIRRSKGTSPGTATLISMSSYQEMCKRECRGYIFDIEHLVNRAVLGPCHGESDIGDHQVQDGPHGSELLILAPAAKAPYIPRVHHKTHEIVASAKRA